MMEETILTVTMVTEEGEIEVDVVKRVVDDGHVWRVERMSDETKTLGGVVVEEK